MRILFNIGHPAQVHFFKNTIWELQKRGHVCKITTSDKDVAIQLLKAYGFEYEVIGKSPSTLIQKAVELIKKDWKILRIAKKFKPDVLVGGVGNVYVAHVGKIIGKPSIVFDDTEHSKFEHFLMDTFITVICTPVCYTKNLGKKQVRYNGFKELAYLHPKYFKPNPDTLKEAGITPGEKFVIIRFVSWDAAHDIGNNKEKEVTFNNLISEIEKKVKIIITSEAPIECKYKHYMMKIPPEKMHDLLYYATIYIGEGATMASEAAILGTPAIYVNNLKPGTISEQVKYGLLYYHLRNDKNIQKIIEEISSLLNVHNLKSVWKQKQAKMLNDKIDVTEYVVQLIENSNIKKSSVSV
ncbi:MAG: DUF354 domain-containing protein [Euryarchaeota archaeon]|nr:DUF354 domain-containing protein [Euryarchaeota archaeon]